MIHDPDDSWNEPLKDELSEEFDEVSMDADIEADELADGFEDESIEKAGDADPEDW